MKQLEEKLNKNYSKMLYTVEKQILKATPKKTVAVWPLTSHQTDLDSKMNKTCRVLLVKYKQIPKGLFSNGLWLRGHTSVD